MRRQFRRFVMLCTVMAVGVVMIGSSTPVDAAANVPLANWQMNEGPGASTMVDSSGNGINGSIGSAVITGNNQNGVTFYRWTSTQPNEPPTKPERLIQVNDSRLNPGTRDYAITIRFRTTHDYGNMIQKGQSGAQGGYFKWQIPNGKVGCLFRGRSTSGAVQSKSVNSGDIPLNDGQWHVVTCERTATRLTMTIDNTRTRKANGPTGSISNNVPLTIAGKKNCDQIETTCDYFAGEIDYIKIETS